MGLLIDLDGRRVWELEDISIESTQFEEQRKHTREKWTWETLLNVYIYVTSKLLNVNIHVTNPRKRGKGEAGKT